MVQFAESDYNRSQRAYETACGQANASDQTARAASRKSTEDNLVEQGIGAIEAYEALLDKRWQQASCLAEYDGIGMGRAIAKRARARWQELQNE